MKTRIHSLIRRLALLATTLTATTVLGQGLGFDGQSNYVEVNGFGTGRKLTAEAWIRFGNDGSSGDRHLMGVEDDSGQWYWHLHVSGQGQLKAKFADMVMNPWGDDPLYYKGVAPFMELTSGTGAIQSGQWHHVAFAVRAFVGPGASEGVNPCTLEQLDYRAEGTLLIDGTAVATQMIRNCGLERKSPSTLGSPLYIGGSPSTKLFKGRIKDVRYSAVAHDQQFINDHMQSPASGSVYHARWPMDDLGALPQVADVADFSRHGTFIGTLGSVASGHYILKAYDDRPVTVQSDGTLVAGGGSGTRFYVHNRNNGTYGIQGNSTWLNVDEDGLRSSSPNGDNPAQHFRLIDRDDGTVGILTAAGWAFTDDNIGGQLSVNVGQIDDWWTFRLSPAP